VRQDGGQVPGLSHSTVEAGEPKPKGTRWREGGLRGLFWMSPNDFEANNNKTKEPKEGKMTRAQTLGSVRTRLRRIATMVANPLS
jgi:hypothetical protein